MVSHRNSVTFRPPDASGVFNREWARRGLWRIAASVGQRVTIIGTNPCFGSGMYFDG